MKHGLKKLSLALIAAGLSFSAMAVDITIADASDPISLDPHQQLSGGTLQMSHMIFDPLVRWTQDLQFESRLATKWERIDDSTMRFHLRKGVQFHSGNTFSADDVVWTFKRLKSSPDFKGIFTKFKEVKKIDDYTIELITDGPYPLVLNSATYIFPMDSKFYSGQDERGRDKSEIAKHGDSFASTHFSGTGPYKVTKREQGIELKYERFDDYWDTQSPGNVDTITLRPIKEGATRVAALLAGDVDMISAVDPVDHKRVERTKNIDLVTLQGTRIITFQMNQNNNEALKNVKVRQAIVHAINNEGIVKKIMKGFATTAGQMSPEGYQGYTAALEPRFDLKKAKQLMKEAGYEKGFKLSLMAPNNRYTNDGKIAQAVAGMLSKIKIDVDLKTLPKAQYWPEFDKCVADMMMIGWHSDTEDSANFYEFLTNTRNAETGSGQYNCGYYSNASVDKLTHEANAETDTQKRISILQRIEKTQYDDAAFVPLHWQNHAWAAKSHVDIKPIVNAMNYPYFGDLVVKK